MLGLGGIASAVGIAKILLVVFLIRAGGPFTSGPKRPVERLGTACLRPP
jgi:hypothetical protein